MDDTFIREHIEGNIHTVETQLKKLQSRTKLMTHFVFWRKC